MMTTQTKTIRFLEIDPTPGPAKYIREVDFDATGLDHLGIIEEAVRNDKPPTGQDRTPPEAGLDIDVGSAKGMMVLAIRLPNFTRDSELVYLLPPIEPLRSSHPAGEPLLSEIHPRILSDTRWAWFECDLESVRKTELARGIKATAATKAVANNLVHDRVVLTIPFMLNVFERKLGCAPWMVPASHDHAPLLTHGGVHPQFACYVTLDLDP